MSNGYPNFTKGQIPVRGHTRGQFPVYALTGTWGPAVPEVAVEPRRTGGGIGHQWELIPEEIYSYEYDSPGIELTLWSETEVQFGAAIIEPEKKAYFYESGITIGLDLFTEVKGGFHFEDRGSFSIDCGSEVEFHRSPNALTEDEEIIAAFLAIIQ